MKIKELTNLIQSINNNDLDNIRIQNKQNTIIISKVKIDSNCANVNTKTKKNNIKKRKKIIPVKNNLPIQEKSITENGNIYSTIVSPMVGTFYQSPAPNEPSFIEIGELVKPKQTVCIIEAMKLMNEIESEVHGEIVEILVNNGDIVDCGQALIKIKIK